MRDATSTVYMYCSHVTSLEIIVEVALYNTVHDLTLCRCALWVANFLCESSFAFLASTAEPCTHASKFRFTFLR